MDPKTIYFHQSPHHRQRQRDTVQQASRFFKIRSNLEHSHFLEDHTLKNFSLRGKINSIKTPFTQLAKKIFPLNVKWVDQSFHKADLFYFWGGLPLNPPGPYFIELDNPYVLSLYHFKRFQWFKPLIKQFLRDPLCKGIICISRACQKNFLFEMGGEFKEKTHLLYPLIENPQPRIQKENSTPFTFLFVSTRFKLKGGHPLLKAFELLKKNPSIPPVHLDVVTDLGDLEPGLLKNPPDGVTFHPLVSREKIRNHLFTRANALVVPTFYDSLGLVFMEALAYSLPIIATNTYAVGEFCLNGFNGSLLKNPFYPPGKPFPFGFCQKKPFEFWERKDPCPPKTFTLSLIRSMEEVIRNGRAYSANSKALFLEKFSTPIWETHFQKLISIGFL